MVFIKTDNRNCFSLNFLLRLDLVELDFSWNNILVSCPIDFCCKRNKSPMWLCCSHLEMVKNMYSVSPLFKEQRGFPCPLISVHLSPLCPLLYMNLWQAFFQLKAIFTFRDNSCLEHSKDRSNGVFFYIMHLLGYRFYAGVLLMLENLSFIFLQL